MAALFFSTTFSSQAQEIKFLKIKYMSAQEGMGGATMEASRLRWNEARAQERLGQIIRDTGPQGKFDQSLLGKGMAEAALLKWQVGMAEEAVGSAIVKTSMIVSKEVAIMGKEAIQERIGAMIQAKAQGEWAASEEAKSFAGTRTAALQEEKGRTIQKTAQFNWAEGEVAKAVRTAHLSGKVSEPIPSEVLFSLRSATGFESEENLRMALTFMEREQGVTFTKLLPVPEVTGAAGPATYTVVGWERGLGAFASLLGFVGAMVMFSWTLTDLDRARVKKTEEREEEEEFRKAA